MKTLFWFILFPALLPVVILLIYVYSKDKKEREPIGVVFKTFIFGALISLVCIPAEHAAGNLIDASFEQGTFLYYLTENVLGVALIEEFVKWLVFMLYIWKNRNFDYKYDGIVYAVTSSLGFAALENLIYVMNLGTGVSLSRALFAIPGHTCFGVFMGFYLSRAKMFKTRHKFTLKTGSLIMSLLVPTLIHGFYDFLLSDFFGESQVLFFIYVICLDVASFLLIRNQFKADKPFRNVTVIQEDEMNGGGNENNVNNNMYDNI